MEEEDYDFSGVFSLEAPFVSTENHGLGQHIKDAGSKKYCTVHKLTTFTPLLGKSSELRFNPSKWSLDTRPETVMLVIVLLVPNGKIAMSRDSFRNEELYPRAHFSSFRKMFVSYDASPL